MLALAAFQVLIADSPTALTKAIALPGGGEVVAYDLDRNRVRPGEKVDLDLVVDGPLPAPGSVRLELVGPGEAALAEEVRAPAPSELRPGHQRLRLRVEVRATQGTWKLRLAGGRPFGLLRVI